MNPSRNLFLIGPTGAGKTCIGRRLAAHYGLLFVDLDREIEQHTGVPVATVFEIEGEAGFRQRESALLDECTKRDGVLLATGAGAVLDPLNRDRLAQRGYVLWLDTTVEQQLERLARDTRRPLLAGENRRGKLEGMAMLRTPLYREIADLALSGAHEPASEATARCIALLDDDWQRRQAA